MEIYLHAFYTQAQHDAQERIRFYLRHHPCHSQSITCSVTRKCIYSLFYVTDYPISA